MIAARPTIRVWDPDTGKFDRARALTSRLPEHPAAVMLYHRGRTPLLALDFDAKLHGQTVLDEDVARALAWITEAGGVAITDRSASGGRHILVPLAIGTSATLAEMNQLMRLLESRLPSLDKTPMTNPTTGCITAPGSPCREGGHRILDGPIEVAIDALTTRSEPCLLPRLSVLLGALPATAPDRPTDGTTALTGAGPHAKLDPKYVRTSPLPDRITAYATTGQLPPNGAWLSHSEARQSVLAHAALHGHSLASIRALVSPGRPWSTGLGAAYARYRHHADKALGRDFTKALTWAAAHSPKFRPNRAQEQQHTGGVLREASEIAAWLTHATAWVEATYPGHRYRWIGAAVFQALAIHAARAGTLVNGVPVVGVGGRSLSLATGMLAETTVWDFLREIRDVAGAPLVRTRVAQGRNPDYYALTQQNRWAKNTAELHSIRIENVHPAWKVIGHRHRRIYELIAHRGLATPADIFAAAHVATSTGYTTLAALATAGLIIRSRGRVTVGPTSLGDIAAAHHLDEDYADRIARHRRERATWHDWLAIRDAERDAERALPAPDNAATNTIVGASPATDHEDYLASVMANGPPADDVDQHDVLGLVIDILGGRIIAAA